MINILSHKWNTNQNETDSISEWLSLTKWTMTNSGEHQHGAKEPYYTIGRNAYWCCHNGNQDGGFSIN
jgi:hypothetical protein